MTAAPVSLDYSTFAGNPVVVAVVVVIVNAVVVAETLQQNKV